MSAEGIGAEGIGAEGIGAEGIGAVRIAAAGAGLIGQRHLEEIDASSSAEVAAIVYPCPAAAEVAAKLSVALNSSLAELFEIDNPDGVNQATPNQLQVAGSVAVWRAWPQGSRWSRRPTSITNSPSE